MLSELRPIFLAYCIKFTTQKTNVYELSYPKCIGVLDSCRNFHLMRTLLSDLNVSCCILNSRREHLPLNWGYKNQNKLQSRYWFNVSVENHSHPLCYFKRERISVDSKLISGTSFEIKASCVLFEKEEFDCLFNIVSFWSQ